MYSGPFPLSSAIILPSMPLRFSARGSMHAHNPPLPLLYGRDRELSVLRHHLDAALSGHGSLILIGGEAGIGKTALAEVMCRAADEKGARVLVGHSYDLSETPPYGPWAEALARAPASDQLPTLPV